jgi:hypothetical protein
LTYDVHNTKLRIPGSISICLFVTTIPHLHYGDEGRRHAGFKRTKEEARSHEASEIRCGCHTAEHGAPATRSASDDSAIRTAFSPTEHHDCEEFASRKLDEEIGNDRLPYQLRNVYDGPEPAVFVVD